MIRTKPALAVFELPLSVVRFYLPNRVVPEVADVYVIQAYDGLMVRQ